MTDLLAQRQYEEAGVNDEAAATKAAVLAEKLNTHTNTIAIVESFNPTKQTAVVRPVAKRYFIGEGFKPLPPIMDVPVMFPRGGGFVLTFPVEKGDECAVWFAERAIDEWHKAGGVQEPGTFRTHDMSDAFAQVGISSIPRAVSNFNGRSVELRRLDGEAKVQIDGKDINVTSSTGDVSISSSVGTIKLNAPAGANPIVNGVLNGSHPCPILGAVHGAFGPPCQRVLAGNT